MDIQMPLLDGVETTRIIRSGHRPGVDPDIPILALTAYAMNADAETFLDEGMNGYLSKPLNSASLIQEILRLTGGGLAGPAKAAAPAATSSVVVAASPEVDRDNRVNMTQNHDMLPKEEVLRRLHNDPVILDRLCTVFLEDTAHTLELIAQGLQEDDCAAVHKLSHSLKSSASSLGAMGLSRLAAVLEEASRNENLPLSRSVFEQLQASARTSMNCVTGWVSGHS